MYDQSDIRNPASAESISAHRRWAAVDKKVGDLIKSRRNAAAAELVEMLHNGADAQLVWKALSTGMVNKYDNSGSAPVISFAGLCFARGRLDLLRAVHAAAQPEWLRAMPRFDDPVAQFKTLEFPLPEVESASDWLRVLATYQTWAGADNTHHVSLFRIAVEPTSKHTGGFLEFALDVDPLHPDIEDMRERNPEGYAMLTQMRMRRHIAATLPPDGSAAEPAHTRRPRAGGI